MKTILYIDDDRILSDLYREIMEEAGYEVWAAASGLAALRILDSKGLPNLVFVDYCMPGMSGEEFIIEALARFPQLASIRTIGFTGMRETDPDALRFAKLVTEVVQKPNDLDEFLDLVKRVLT